MALGETRGVGVGAAGAGLGEALFVGGWSSPGGSRVSVSDSTGRLLGETMTDENGEFRFSIAVKEPLTIVARTADGHRAEFVLAPAGNEAGHPSAASQPFSEPSEGALAGGRSEASASSGGGAEAGPVTLSAGELEAAIEHALEEKLGPIRRELAQMSRERVSVQDVIAGVGFILGIFGAAALARRPRT